MSSYEERNKDSRFKVTRWCCTSGNCSKCSDRPFGNRIRVIQILTDDADQAVRCCDNYRHYGSEMWEGGKSVKSHR